jgi:solute carrier family 25 carnitine/acylcarnitine transporter 20/29
LESFIAGSISGMASIVVCHPFDVLRTKIQLSTTNLSYYKILQNEFHFSNLYKGFLVPFAAQGLYKAIVFSTFSFSNNYLHRGEQSSLSTFFSGLLAGTLNSFVVSPVELVRTRIILENKTANSNQLYSIYECVKNIKSEKGLFGLWRGIIPTIIRDGPGVGFYMFSFRYFKNYFSSFISLKRHEFNNNNTWLIKICAGSLAGISFWIWALPMDTIKTLIESEKTVVGKMQSNVSFIEKYFKPVQLTVQKLMANGVYNGIKKLYNAWPLAISRGIPSAAVTLTTFDVVSEYLISIR